MIMNNFREVGEALVVSVCEGKGVEGDPARLEQYVIQDGKVIGKVSHIKANEVIDLDKPKTYTKQEIVDVLREEMKDAYGEDIGYSAAVNAIAERLGISVEELNRE